MAVELLYVDRRFTVGSTRGDGIHGKTLPKPENHSFDPVESAGRETGSPQRLEVRGEVFLSRQAFQLMNREREEQGQPVFANPRNAAAALLKQLDSTITAKRPWTSFAMAVG